VCERARRGSAESKRMTVGGNGEDGLARWGSVGAKKRSKGRMWSGWNGEEKEGREVM